jgi:SAM-dependent methyltransferase
MCGAYPGGGSLHRPLDPELRALLSGPMQFVAPADHYDRFMGRYAPTLAAAMVDAAGIEPGMRVLDVGCGPGGLTHELVSRAGPDGLAAIDPAPQFAAACQERHPGVDVRVGPAEDLPWDDGTFDAALAQLVIAFMRDPDRGVREMARVTRPGGTVAHCMWNIAGGGMTMLRVYWTAVRSIVPAAQGEQSRPGTMEGDLAERFRRAGLEDVTQDELTARADYTGFDDFWQPFTLAVGPAGEYLRSLSEEQQAAVREACRAELPSDGPFSLEARAWFARGTVPG